LLICNNTFETRKYYWVALAIILFEISPSFDLIIQTGTENYTQDFYRCFENCDDFTIYYIKGLYKQYTVEELQLQNEHSMAKKVKVLVLLFKLLLTKSTLKF